MTDSPRSETPKPLPKAVLPDSPLPREPAYWDQLAQNVGRDATGPLAQYQLAERVWYGELARRAHWLMAAAAAAMFFLWVSLPASDSPTRASSMVAGDAPASPGWIEGPLNPDEIAGMLVAGPVPPSVDALMVQFPPEQLRVETP